MQAAIQATLAAIQNRARLYRNLVVSVTAVLIGSVVVAVVFRSLIPLIGFSLLVPLAGAYFVLDNRCTRLWSKQVLEMWAEGKLNLTAFSGAISAHPYVPRGTLEGMLGLLLLGGETGRLASLKAEDRTALCRRVDDTAGRHQRRIVLATAGLMSMLVFLIAAIILRSVSLYFFLAVSLALWFIAKRP